MNLQILKPGHKVKLRDGAVAKVLAETGDGNSIRVEYLESGGSSSPVGAEAMVDEREIEALLGVAHPRTWGEEATAILHHVPESEDSEAGFEAVTMKGVPYGVVVTGHDPDSAEGALNNLLDGLRAFGFEGRLSVEDVTRPGTVERYEV
jgi:hypothetical protein